jgi:hypothetical protein
MPLGTTAPGPPRLQFDGSERLEPVEDALAERVERLHPPHRIADIGQKLARPE